MVCSPIRFSHPASPPKWPGNSRARHKYSSEFRNTFSCRSVAAPECAPRVVRNYVVRFCWCSPTYPTTSLMVLSSKKNANSDCVSRVSTRAEADVLFQLDRFAAPGDLVVRRVLSHRDFGLVSGVPETRRPSARFGEVWAANAGLGTVVRRRQPLQRAVEEFRSVEVAGVSLNAVLNDL